MDNQRGNIEVSLPGAGESEPTILEVINRNTITNSETESQIETETETTSPESQPLQNINQETEKDFTNDVQNIESKTLTTQELHEIAKNTLGNINLNTNNNNNNNKDTENIESDKTESDKKVKDNKTEFENILDIESHLIETYENFSVSEESDNSGVAIRECQPAKEEFKRSSQIETETSPKTIIEIEPSIPKALKPIELDLDLNIKKQFGIETTEIINDTITNNLKEECDKFIENEQTNEIKTSHIEEKLNENIISEKEPQDLDKKNSIEENITDTNSTNSDIGIGINGLQNCITPLEEEEKKKLLDSLPQLDENDSNSLSIQAKKEYYQSLRDYLDKHQDDRPPIPLKTYRWEDLRRAKEKGGYPWTHLYKRPLGPEEEPEIVLLLRKSQEFRFSSESPRSLKKVRIHDQVFIKETERYINDLSDTEDNPEIIIVNIKNTEDNHSLNSETVDSSSPSNSVPKKSKLSKLKGILKRRSSTNETKLNSPNKSVNKKSGTTTDGEDNISLHSESAISGISDSVPEDKKSKINKLKGLVQRQSGDVKNKKSKESASIFYGDETTIAANQSELSEAKKSKFDKFKNIVKGGKNIDGEKIDTKETSIVAHPTKRKSSLSDTPLEDDNQSVHSESVIFAKTSKLSKLRGFVKRRGDKKQEDTKSVQSESALDGKQSTLKKLQGAFKIRKGEKKEEESKQPESIENSPIIENIQSETEVSGLSESVPESKNLKINKTQELIKKESDSQNSEVAEEDSKSIQSESAISSKSDSTLERKKLKLGNLKEIFKRQENSKIQKPEELEKPTTDLDEPTNSNSHTEETKNIETETELSTSAPKNKTSKLTKLKGIVKNKTAVKKPTPKKVENSPNKEVEIAEEDTDNVQTESAISSKSDSTTERKKLKLGNLKQIFKRQEDSKSQTPEELGKPTTDLDEPTSLDSHTEETQSIPTETESSASVSKTKKSKLEKLKEIGKDKSAEKNTTSNTTSPSSADENSTNEEVEISQEDTKSVQSASAISSKSESTLERKKFKLSNLKGLFKSQQDDKSKKPEKLEKISTGIDEPTSPDSHSEETQSIQSDTESSISVPKSKALKLKKLKTIGTAKSAEKKPTSKKVISPSPTTDENSTNEEVEISEEDTKSLQSESAISSKSESTLDRKKFKLSNLKGLFKTQQGDKSKKPEELEKISADLHEPTTPVSHIDEEQGIQSETQSGSAPKSKTTKLKKLKGIVKHRSTAKKPRSKKLSSSAENSTEGVNNKSEDSPEKEKCCQPIMDKLKNLTDKQFKKRNIKKVPLKDEEKIILEEEQKILKLRESPKSVRGEIPKFVEKQDSEDLLEIVQLEESPSQKRKEPTSSILIPDEIIEIPSHTLKTQERQQNIDPSITPEPTVSEILEADMKTTPPVKALRKMKAHIYEDIENNEPTTIEMKIDEILQLASVEALKKSLASQDQSVLKDMESNKQIPLDRMGSSEEEIEKTTIISNGINHLAPISSIDSASSDEQDKRTQLSPVAEESDACSTDGKDVIVIEDNHDLDIKSALKREPSPSPSVGDKKVTFSHVEDDAEPHREDIEIPEELKGMPNRWSTMK